MSSLGIGMECIRNWQENSVLYVFDDVDGVGGINGQDIWRGDNSKGRERCTIVRSV